MPTLKFFSNYAAPADLLRRFAANYDITDGQLSFTCGEAYDYAVVFNRTDELLQLKAKVITIIQEPSWSPAHDAQGYLRYSDYLVIHDPDLFERSLQLRLGGRVIPSPSCMFYHDPADHSFFDSFGWIRKTKKLSMIVSSLGMEQGNYRKRLALLSALLASDLDLDVYGRGLEGLTDTRYKGPLDFKYSGLLPYAYSIAIENSNEHNYITEKFTDCLLCHTIPVYNGAPNIAQVYDPRYFRQLDLDSADPAADIQRLIAGTVPDPLVNLGIYRREHNLYQLLKKITLENHFG